jgi:hypothetical protein
MVMGTNVTFMYVVSIVTAPHTVYNKVPSYSYIRTVLYCRLKELLAATVELWRQLSLAGISKTVVAVRW